MSRCKAKSWIRELQTPQLPDTHLELFRDTKQLDRYTGIIWMHELTLKSHQCITNSETLQKTCLLHLCCMSLKGRYVKFPKWSWEKCVCVRELMRFMWGWLSTDSPGLSHLCVGVFFFPLWDHWWSLWLKTKSLRQQRTASLGEGQDLIVVKLWEESHWCCCEEMCELQAELPCWVTPCEGQCAVTGECWFRHRNKWNFLWASARVFTARIRCAVCLCCASSWCQSWQRQRRLGWCLRRHKGMKTNKVHLRAEWIITTPTA